MQGQKSLCHIILLGKIKIGMSISELWQIHSRESYTNITRIYLKIDIGKFWLHNVKVKKSIIKTVHIIIFPYKNYVNA